jgi:hypothetical protein
MRVNIVPLYGVAKPLGLLTVYSPLGGVSLA